MASRKTELVEMFTFHPPPDRATGDAHQEVRDRCKGLATSIVRLTPDCDEQRIAIEKVREAMMYANAAIAIHGRKKP